MATTPYHPEYLYKQIAYCARSECPLSKRCLRHLTYLVAPTFYEAPFVDPRLPMGSACERYLDSEPVRFARGFRRGIRLLRHGDVADFQARLSYELGCSRTQYYRYFRGATRLSPEKQAVVLEVFEEFEVTEAPLFDSFEEGYILG